MSSAITATVDRTVEINAARERQPPAIKQALRHYYGHKAHKKDHRLILEQTIRAGDLAAEFAAISTDNARMHEMLVVKGLYSDKLRDEMQGGQSSFRGMSAADFIKEVRGERQELQKALERARDDLAKTGIKETLQEGAAFRKRRRRSFSEHDGDWDHDRRWDCTPFQGIKSDRKEFPFVEFIFPTANSSGVSKEQITEFGSRCLALAEIMETAGYRVAITGEEWGGNRNATPRGETFEAIWKSVGGNGMPDGTISITRFLIREANDYGDIQSMALFGSSEFYRRCIFSLCYNTVHYNHALGKEMEKLNCESGYGEVIADRPIPCEPGQIVLTHSMLATIFGYSKEQAAELFKNRILGGLRSDTGGEQQSA